MCYTVTPGTSNKIRAIHMPSRPTCSELPALPKLLRRTDDVCIASGEREPINAKLIPQAFRRQFHRPDHKRGKRMAKRQHKPNWFDGYLKF